VTTTCEFKVQTNLEFCKTELCDVHQPTPYMDLHVTDWVWLIHEITDPRFK